jgi:hypothetical protein
MADKELEIGIKVTSDTTGVAQAKQGLDQVNSALQKTQTAEKGAEEGSKGLLDSFGALGHRGNEAREAVEGVARASEGGAGAIFGIAQAVRALLNVIRGGVAASGPIGLFVTILGTLGGLLLVIREKFFSAGEAAEKTATSVGEANTAIKDTKKSAEDANTKLKDLADKGLTDATSKAKELEDQFDKTSAAIERAAAAAGKIRQAENDRKLAQIEADQAAGKISPEKADAAKFNLSRDAAKGDVAAQEKLAADIAKKEKERVDAAQKNVDNELTFGKLEAGTQNDLLKRKAEVSDELGALRDTAEKINEAFDAKVADLQYQKQKPDLLDSPAQAGKKELDNKVLEGLIEGVNENRQKTLSGYAERVTPLAQESEALDKSLQKTNETLAQSNGALLGFLDALKATKAKAEERIKLVNDDLKTTQKVEGIKQGTADIRQTTKTDAALKQSSATADAAAKRSTDIEAQIKKRKDDAFLGAFGQTADTSDLEKQLADARAQEAAAQKSTADILEGQKSIKQKPQPIEPKTDEDIPKTDAGPGKIIDAEGNVHLIDRKTGPGGTIQKDGKTFDVHGGDDKGGGGTIEKDGQTIKVAGDGTVEHMKKTSATMVEAAKAIEKQGPEISKAAAKIGALLEITNATTIAAFGVLGNQTEQLNQQMKGVLQQLRHLQDTR